MEFFSLISIFFLITVIFPIVFWIIFFSYQDRKEPEPKKIIIYVFLWGIIVAFITLILKAKLLPIFFEFQKNLTFDYLFNKQIEIPLKQIILLFIFAATLEEIIKFISLRLLIFTNINFNQIIDGVVYGTTIALGFSFFENSIYFFEFYENLSRGDFFFLSFMRGITSVLLHISATGITGYYLAKARFYPNKKIRYYITGLLLGSFLHILFNLILQTERPYSYIAFVLLIITFVTLVFNLKSSEAQFVWWPANRNNPFKKLKKEQ